MPGWYLNIQDGVGIETGSYFFLMKPGKKRKQTTTTTTITTNNQQKQGANHVTTFRVGQHCSSQHHMTQIYQSMW
jgi:hypothetical protein